MFNIDNHKSLQEIQDEIMDMETALTGICLMIGFALNEKILEERKVNPDHEKIQLLETEFSTYCHERRQIYSGNTDIIKKVLEIYSPLILNRVQNAR
jgi:hypothetical protein